MRRIDNFSFKTFFIRYLFIHPNIFWIYQRFTNHLKKSSGVCFISIPLFSLWCVNHNLGEVFRDWFYSGGLLGGGKIFPLIGNLSELYYNLEIWYKYTYIYSFRNHDSLADVSNFFCKKSSFFGKNSTLTQSNSKSCVRDFLSSIFSFCKIEG